MSDPTDDDNELKGFDLGAWDAPEAPASLADDVIARVGGTEVGAAVPVEERRTRTPRALLIGGVAAAVLALGVGGYALVRGARHVAPMAGTVTAEKAQTLSLDGAHADLDPGAEVKWTRQGRVLRVEQRKGTAAWRVDEDEQLVIDAGAAVASVEATGASLRVEVQMNPTDVRIVGATAVTAAAVAMVTVIVYEGHVKVRDVAHQREFIVEPGTRYTVTPLPPPVVTDDRPVVGVAPVAPNTTIADVAFDAGESATIHDPSPPTAVQINTAFFCMHAASVAVDGTAGNGLAMLGESDHTYEVSCDGKVVKGNIRIVRDPLDRPIDGSHVVTLAKPARGDSWSEPLQIDGTVSDGARLTIDGIAVPVASHGRFATNLPASGRVTIPLRIELPTGTHYALLRAKRTDVTIDTTCDEVSCVLNNYDGACCAKYKDMPDHLGGRDISDAIASLRGEIDACMDDSTATSGTVEVRVDVMPAGSVRSVTIKRGVEPELDACVQKVIAGATFRPTNKSSTFTVPFSFNGTASAGSASRCDAKALRDKGMENVNIGQHAAALAQFEASLQCKDDPVVRTFAYMAACNASNQAKAKLYYGKLSPSDQKRLLQICVRNSIDPTSCDADALKKKGMQLVGAGKHDDALAQFEQSLACKQDSSVLSMAFLSACNAQDSTKAKLYYKQLTPPQQQKLSIICIRNKTAYNDTASCDADDMKDRGMELLNEGKHDAALDWFEKSLACKPDAYVTQLSFMSACNSRNEAKARKYYAQLPADAQKKLKVMCDRNKVDLADPDPNGPKGFLGVNSKPAAKILIDGVDTGLTTPITGADLPLAPGKHKVTFVIGADRFTYPVTIRSGETETMTKDLQ